MSTSRRKFQRPLGCRRYKKLFVISAEGVKTEPQYFAIFNGEEFMIHVDCLKRRRGSSPPRVLKAMESRIRERGLNATDEAWLVVDKDRWTDEQLQELLAWAQRRPNYGFCLSNPSFEYWLLLHFEEGNGIGSLKDCTDRLKRYLPDYDKGVDSKQFPSENIHQAVRRAKTRDNPPCMDWPRAVGGTTVYRLVEHILQVSAAQAK